MWRWDFHATDKNYRAFKKAVIPVILLFFCSLPYAEFGQGFVTTEGLLSKTSAQANFQPISTQTFANQGDVELLEKSTGQIQLEVDENTTNVGFLGGTTTQLDADKLDKSSATSTYMHQNVDYTQYPTTGAHRGTQRFEVYRGQYIEFGKNVGNYPYLKVGEYLIDNQGGGGTNFKLAGNTKWSVSPDYFYIFKILAMSEHIDLNSNYAKEIDYLDFGASNDWRIKRFKANQGGLADGDNFMVKGGSVTVHGRVKIGNDTTGYVEIGGSEISRDSTRDMKIKNTVTAGVYALDFDGVSDYVGYTAGAISGDINGASGVTVECWLKIEDTPSDGDAVSIYARSTSNTYGAQWNGFIFKIKTNGELWAYGRSIYSEGIELAVSSVLTEGDWIHIAVAYDYANDNITIYIDGDEDVSTAVTFNETSYTDSGTHTTKDALGLSWSNTIYNPFMGIIDEFRMYDVILTSTEVKESYDNKAVPTARTGDLILHCKLDEGAGTDALDETANDNDGTVSGADWVTGYVPTTGISLQDFFTLKDGRIAEINSLYLYPASAGSCSLGSCDLYFKEVFTNDLKSKGSLGIYLDNNNDGTDTFDIYDGVNANIFSLAESGALILQGSVDFNSNDITELDQLYFDSANTILIEEGNPNELIMGDNDGFGPGHFSSLPTSGFRKGIFIFNTTVDRMYYSTETVTSADSWIQIP